MKKGVTGQGQGQKVKVKVKVKVKGDTAPVRVIIEKKKHKNRTEQNTRSSTPNALVIVGRWWMAKLHKETKPRPSLS